MCLCTMQLSLVEGMYSQSDMDCSFGCQQAFFSAQLYLHLFFSCCHVPLLPHSFLYS